MQNRTGLPDFSKWLNVGSNVIKKLEILNELNMLVDGGRLNQLLSPETLQALRRAIAPYQNLQIQQAVVFAKINQAFEEVLPIIKILSASQPQHQVTSQSLAAALKILQDKDNHVADQSSSATLSPTELMNIFLNTDIKNIINGERFFGELYKLLPPNYFKLNKDNQCNIFYDLRQQEVFIKLLTSNWQLTALFMKSLLHQAKFEMVQKIMGSRLGKIYELNNIRQAVIPSEMRQRIPIQQQQQAVMQMIERRQRQVKEKPPVVMPNIELNQRTVLIERRADQGELSENRQAQYQDLICPLSLGLFKDPVKVTQNNVTFYFERSHIEEAIKQNPVNPMNRQPLRKEDLQEAPEKKAEVEIFKAEVMAEIEKSTPEKGAQSTSDTSTSTPHRHG